MSRLKTLMPVQTGEHRACSSDTLGPRPPSGVTLSNVSPSAVPMSRKRSIAAMSASSLVGGIATAHSGSCGSANGKKREPIGQRLVEAVRGTTS